MLSKRGRLFAFVDNEVEMYLNDVADIKFVFPEKAQETSVCDAFWVTASCLQANNEIVDIKSDSTFIPDDNLLLRNDDIVIKRISPQFVNLVSDVNGDWYAASNLIIIKANNGYSAKYLAYVLETNIEKLYQDAVGSVMPAIGRKGIFEFDIGSPPPLIKQEIIGELWWLLKEKKKLTEKLYEKETIMLKQQLRKLAYAKGDK